MTRKKRVDSVVKDGLCAQCGWCILSCPAGAITQQETSGGYLLPKIDEVKCNNCGLCYRMCPGWHVENLTQAKQCDEFEGTVLAAFCGFATNSEVRQKSQSGGIVSALLLHQTANNPNSRAIVCRMPNDGSLRPYAMLAKTSKDIVASCGSKYCPVRFNPELGKHLFECQNATVVGVSCQLQAVRNLQLLSPQWRDRCGLLIGLFCDRIMSLLAIQKLCSRAGVSFSDVKGFQYRSKEWKGWPGDVLIELNNGRKEFLPFSERIRIKDVFTPSRCRMCFDKMNIFSDITLGDAHGLRTDNKGHSLILARTENGLAALQAAANDGVIALEPVSADVVLKAVHITNKRREWATYVAAWESMGRKAPDFHFSSNCQLPADKGSQRKKIRQFIRADRLAFQPSRELALKEAQRQLVQERHIYWLSGSWLRRHASNWLSRLIRK